MNTKKPHDRLLNTAGCVQRGLRACVILSLVGSAWITIGGDGASLPIGYPAVKRLPKVGILPTAPCELFAVEVGANVFTGSETRIEALAPEMRGLNGVRVPQKDANGKPADRPFILDPLLGKN